MVRSSIHTQTLGLAGTSLQQGRPTPACSPYTLQLSQLFAANLPRAPCFYSAARTLVRTHCLVCAALQKFRSDAERLALSNSTDQLTNQSAKSGSGSLLRSSLLCTSSAKSSAFPFTRLARNLARVFSETCWQNFNASSTLCTGPAAFAGSHAAWKAPSHCRNEMPPSRSPGPPSKTQVCLSHTEPPQRALLIQSQFLQH